MVHANVGRLAFIDGCLNAIGVNGKATQLTNKVEVIGITECLVEMYNKLGRFDTDKTATFGAILNSLGIRPELVLTEVNKDYLEAAEAFTALLGNEDYDESGNYAIDALYNAAGDYVAYFTKGCAGPHQAGSYTSYEDGAMAFIDAMKALSL